MATLKEIAKMAGVSESTVSRSLHENPRIAAVTRARIKKMAEELHFEFNANAQSLSTRKCSTVGIVYPDFNNSFHCSYYLDMLVHDVRHCLEAAGYDCLLFQATQPGTGASNIMRLVQQKKIDGFVFVISDMHASIWNILAEKKIPLVQVHSKPVFRGAVPETEDYDWFYTDNYQGGKLAGGHLLERGCRRFICLADAGQNPEMQDRTRGFTDALRESGAENSRIHVMTCAPDFDSVYRFVHGNRDFFKPGDGLFAHTDIMAIAAMQALRDGGIAIPRHVKIVGYDDIHLCDLVRPTLTSIHQPREEQAELACRRLVQLIEQGYSGKFQQRMIAPRLVTRGSSAGGTTPPKNTI